MPVPTGLVPRRRRCGRRRADRAPRAPCAPVADSTSTSRRSSRSTLATQSTILCAAVGALMSVRWSGGVKHGELNARFVYPARDGLRLDHLPLRLGHRSLRPPPHGVHPRAGRAATPPRATRTGSPTSSCCCGRGVVRRVRAREGGASRPSRRRRTKAELLAAALERGLLIAPVATLAEVAAEQQLAARDYFQTPDAPGGGPGRPPSGPFAKFAAQPDPLPPPRADDRRARARDPGGARGCRARRRAGLTRRGTGRRLLPLDDVKVLDFMWAVAGPAATRMLADSRRHGRARRVDPPHRRRAARMPPFQRRAARRRVSALFHSPTPGSAW